MKDMKKELMAEIRNAYRGYMLVIKYSSDDMGLKKVQRYGLVMIGRIDMCIDFLSDNELVSENSIALLNGFRQRFFNSLTEIEVL